jgi:hypothetical protein
MVGFFRSLIIIIVIIIYLFILQSAKCSLERRAWVGSSRASYLGCPEFYSRPGGQLSWLRSSCISSRLLSQDSILNRSPPLPSQFVMNSHPPPQWDFRFLRRWVWRWLSSGLLRSVVYLRFRGLPDDGVSKHLWNAGKLLVDDTAQ